MSDEAGTADAAPRDTLTLAATDRLARQLREDANLARARSGGAVWEAPRIAGFSRWLTDAWTSGWPDAQLLNTAQELVLWREAIERDEVTLLAPLAAAREARRADQLVRRYRIALDAVPAWQDEHHAFRRWRRHVTRRLREQRWITAADVAGEVAQRIAAGEMALPETIRLVGLVAALPPSEQAVIEALEGRGVRVERVDAAFHAVRVSRYAIPDEEAQWRHVAHDIRGRLRERADDPPRIIIALPDAEAPRVLAESVLRALLAPWVAQGEGAQPWRWERGTPLSDLPPVDTLLALLQLRASDNAPELVSRVLLSAGLWTEAERAHTARADYALRQRGAPRIGLAMLQTLLPDVLAARFEAFAQALARLPARALPSEWAAHFRALLDAIGWPGGDALDSAAFQAVRSARGLLDRLGTLDVPLGRVPGASAREWLAELARSARLSPRVEHAQPVLITSLEEAASLRADVLYVLDATAARLPSAARPTAFLPLDAQRAAGIAEASPEAWLARTQAQVAMLLSACAPEVHVYAPRVDARGAELQPSIVLGAIEAWRPIDAERRVSAVERALSEETPAAIWPGHDPVPAVDQAELATLHADSALFRDWFESPFFAFCAYRLGIEPLPRPGQGLDARVQGTLAHAVLEDLWGRLRDSHALATIDDAALGAHIAASVDAHLARLMPEPAFGAVTRALERARACDVVAQWLLHERERCDPFTVERCELRAEPVVAGLQLRLRLDRVDRVETPFGERWLVIDYKTGREADPRGWKAERPLEPQLPLYASHAVTAAAGIPQVDGICFGHLKDGHPALVARTSWRAKLIEQPDADTATEWREQLAQWRAAMEDAARGFLAGEAWLDPRVNARSPNAPLLALGGASPDDEGDDA
jgi:probable DNA repair protein